MRRKKSLTQRQRIILEALLNCNSKGTTSEIATKAKLGVNGVLQSLRALGRYVSTIRGDTGKGSDKKWGLYRSPPPLSKQLWSKLNYRRNQLHELARLRFITKAEQIELIDLNRTADRVAAELDKIHPMKKPVL